jgi:hypothetical protein
MATITATLQIAATFPTLYQADGKTIDPTVIAQALQWIQDNILAKKPTNASIQVLNFAIQM